MTDKTSYNKSKIQTDESKRKRVYCELCDRLTKKWNFPCRDEYGQLAEVDIVCKDCHDEWCLCDCPRVRNVPSVVGVIPR